MTHNPRIFSLNHKHEKIEKEIKKAYNSHETSDKIHELKKLKLAIKDEITNLENNSF